MLRAWAYLDKPSVAPGPSGGLSDDGGDGHKNTPAVINATADNATTSTSFSRDEILTPVL